MSKIQARLLDVTAEMALQWLGRTEELGFHNRTLRNSVVQRYARAMRLQRWEVNGETISFDKEGALINGQHRMHAVLEATTSEDGPDSVPMLVVFGVDRSSFATMDQGLRRTAGDVITLSGLNYANRYAALVRHIYNWEHSRYEDTGAAKLLDNSAVHEIALARRAELEPSILFSRQAQNELGRGSLWAFVHWLLTDHAEDDALDFLEPLVTGANLSTGHPVLTFRNKMLRARANRVVYEPKLVFHMAVRAWNALREERTMGHIATPPLGDPIPELK